MKKQTRFCLAHLVFWALISEVASLAQCTTKCPDMNAGSFTTAPNAQVTVLLKSDVPTGTEQDASINGTLHSYIADAVSQLNAASSNGTVFTFVGNTDMTPNSAPTTSQPLLVFSFTNVANPTSGAPANAGYPATAPDPVTGVDQFISTTAEIDLGAQICGLNSTNQTSKAACFSNANTNDANTPQKYAAAVTGAIAHEGAHILGLGHPKNAQPSDVSSSSSGMSAFTGMNNTGEYISPGGTAVQMASPGANTLTCCDKQSIKLFNDCPTCRQKSRG